MPADGMLSDEESLFTSPGILDIEYLPRLLPFREEQQHYLADCIKRLPGLGTNVLLHGPPGIGKTACIRFIFRQLIESGSDVVPVYINCWHDSDLHRIVLSMCRQFGIETSYRGPDELLSRVLSRLKSSKAVVLAFDEIDRMPDQSFLYHFTEQLPHKCIFLVSTKQDWLAALDNRVRSRLLPESVEFKPYDMGQTRGILLERKDHAFVQGVWHPDAFDLVVSKCFETGDVRSGLAMLKASGLAAEREASRRVAMEHVENALSRLDLRPGKGPAQKERKITEFG